MNKVSNSSYANSNDCVFNTVTEVAGYAKSCSGLTSLTTSATVDYINESVTKAVADNIQSNTTTKPTMPETCKTVLVAKEGKLWAENYKSGVYKSRRMLMPEITDVNVYGTTVVVTFKDGTKTSAALHEEDKKVYKKFNTEQVIEHGISICLTKKLLGENGSSLYNKLVNKALKVKAANEEKRAKEVAEEQARIARKEKYKRKKAERKARAKEEQIEIIKEAYLRAFKELRK